MKSHHLTSRLMYLVANLGQVVLFKFRVTFWHFSIFSVRLYIVLRRREPTFCLFYCSQTVVNILLPQPTTVDSTDFSSHVRLYFFKDMVSHLWKNYYLTEDTLFQWSIYRMHLCWQLDASVCAEFGWNLSTTVWQSFGAVDCIYFNDNFRPTE